VIDGPYAEIKEQLPPEFASARSSAMPSASSSEAQPTK
jgi:hypothetical protein